MRVASLLIVVIGSDLASGKGGLIMRVQYSMHGCICNGGVEWMRTVKAGFGFGGRQKKKFRRRSPHTAAYLGFDSPLQYLLCRGMSTDHSRLNFWWRGPGSRIRETLRDLIRVTHGWEGFICFGGQWTLDEQCTSSTLQDNGD